MQAGSPLTRSIDNGVAAPPPFPTPQAGEGTEGAPAAVDVAVVGAGVIGLSIAWAARIARAFRWRCSSAPPQAPGRALRPPACWQPPPSTNRGATISSRSALESQRQWPQFRAALEAQSGRDIDFREGGTLVVALGRDEVERLRFRHDLHKTLRAVDPLAQRAGGSCHGAGAAGLRLRRGSIAPTIIRSIRGW